MPRKSRTQDPHGAVVGVMHACGHDVHMTNMVGVARYLAGHRDQWSGTIVFVFQPAEETSVGAEAMLRDGLLSRFPRPDFAVCAARFGRCGDREDQLPPGLYVGEMSIAWTFSSKVVAATGRPGSTIDPIVIAAKLIVDLQTIVSREVKPIEPPWSRFGSIHGGTKHNIISDECRFN